MNNHRESPDGSNHTAHAESGYALLAAIFVAMLAGGIVMIMSTVSLSTHRSAQSKIRTLQARYLAEGSVEMAKQVLQDAIAKGATPPATGTASVNGVDVQYTITTVATPNVLTDPSGIQTTTQTYEINAEKTIAGVTGRAGRMVNAEWTPLFQYAVFFEQGLDILPTPDMVLTGRVHTNGDLRLGCNTATLTLDTNSVRAVGGLRRWKKHSNTPTVGNVRIRKWVADPFDPSEPAVYEDLESLSQMTALSIPTTTGYDSLFGGYDGNSDGNYDVGVGDWLPFEAGVLSRYGPPAAYPDPGNSLLLGVHGVTRVAPPPIESIDMFEPATGGDYDWDAGAAVYIPSMPAGSGTHKRGYFHENADLRIIVAPDGLSWTALDGSDFDVTPMYGGVVTLGQTHDKRQGGYVPVVRIDMSALNAPALFPANGLLYVSHYGMGTGTTCKGVHLHNGQDLKSDLTLVTEGSAYIQGDYNTVTKNAAAILADAINLLSNSWYDTTGKPTASNTTYNVALVIGNTETEAGQYNGGLESFPRFHENWSGKTCTVNGSMISAWQNRYATGLVSAAAYNPPIRMYSYDATFNDVTKLPKFSPMIVNVKNLARW